MLRTPFPTLAVALTLLLSPLVARAEAEPSTGPLELKDGDRVVFVGATFVEREAQFG